MKLHFFRVPYAVIVEGEGTMGTSSFSRGDSNGVTDIEATPFGTVVRRQGTLADLIFTPQGWGIVEKRAEVPAGLRKGKA